MMTIKWLKRILTGFIGLSFTINGSGLAKENKKESNVPSHSKEEQKLKLKFSKDELIKSLRKMKRYPEEIKTVCAMCYKMASPPKEVEFQCDKCGNKTIYATRSDQGVMIRHLPYIKRSLDEMPYKISINSTGICSICGENKQKVLIMNVTCFNCGKEFSWEVKNQEDITMLGWLYLKPPIEEVDATDLNIRRDKKDGIKKGAIYIHEHVFCDECRKKNDIE